MNNQDYNQYMKRAIELSKKNVVGNTGGPFGAVVVLNGKIIGEGVNLVTSNNDPTAHAEVEAIRNACKNQGSFDLSGAVIFTSCEPCPMCLSAIYWARIDKIFYANNRADAARIQFDDDLIYTEIPKDPAQRKIPAQELLRNEALKVFDLWAESTAKVRY
ncbi:MAG: nucleoside deaminase [Pseudobdellovibrio sp.]